MTSKLIQTISEGLDLALYLQNEIEKEQDSKRIYRQVKYLGQCLVSMKEHLNAGRDNELPKECQCGRESISLLHTG
jgi:hypothetical protein|tara:strand:+ start:1648 stop:1875 length:228 start_codon:yes stop_codon:yes gene_type:complete